MGAASPGGSQQVALATLLVALLALGAATWVAALPAATAAGALLCAAACWVALSGGQPRGDSAQGKAAEANGAGGAHKPGGGGASAGKGKQAPLERKGDTWRGGTKVRGAHSRRQLL
jgi:hypothetical protein